MPNPSVAYDPNAATYTLTAAGHDIWDGQDGCAFAYTAVDGDFDVVVRVDGDFTGPAANPSSVAGKTYSIYRSSDMVNWETAEEGVPSAGDTLTQWLDPTQPLLSPGVRRRFYKIKENL